MKGVILMTITNIPQVKCGIISVSRDCFIISLSENRRKAIVDAYAKQGGNLYEVQKTVENETDMIEAVAEAKKAGCNALVVFLGNFGPETPETLIAKYFDGPVMYVAAAEETGKNLINGRGDAYCGMLNCSYNLGLRHLKAFIPEYPVGTAEDLAKMIGEFQPVARTLLGLQSLKIITFGPRPQDFFACNAPIKPLFDLGVEVEENSELDLLVSYRAHQDDPRIKDVVADMTAELGSEGNPYPDLLPRMAQYELTLLDWMDAHKGSSKYIAFANKCWPAFPSQFGFEPCYVNSRLVSRGIPVACEVDIYGALSEYIGICVSNDTVTLLDINNSVPKDLFEEHIKPATNYTLQDTFMGFHCGNTPLCKLKKGGVKYQLIQNRLLENGDTPDFTRGTLEGDIAAGEITFFRLQSTAGGQLRSYIAQGEVLPAATNSFGSIGIFAIPEMGRFYRHVLIAKQYPHHGAVAFGHYGKALYSIFQYLGIGDIAFNQPKGMLYPDENPFA
jgi:L-fucose isomerase-like protein